MTGSQLVEGEHNILPLRFHPRATQGVSISALARWPVTLPLAATSRATLGDDGFAAWMQGRAMSPEQDIVDAGGISWVVPARLCSPVTLPYASSLQDRSVATTV